MRSTIVFMLIKPVSATASEMAAVRDKVSGTRRDSPRDRPDNVRETITTVAGMETSRGQQVLEAHGGTDRACATPWKAMPTLSFPQGWVAPSHF
jgi:hypothetical protein